MKPSFLKAPAFVALAIAIGAAQVQARRSTLNDTGMTQCVDHHGNWTAECSKSAQDAADGRDVRYNNPDDGVAGFSFRKVCRSGQMAGEGSCPVDPVMGDGPDNWGCVYDNITQLSWEAKTTDGGIHDYLKSYTNKGKRARDDATDAAWLVDATNAELLCGAANWRIPEVVELQSIVDYGNGAPGTTGPWIDPTFFPNSLSSSTWTNDEYVGDSKSAWYVRFGFGSVGISQRFEPHSALLVRRASKSPLVGGAIFTKDRFIPSLDGTEVTDTTTGLVWRRCAAGMTWNNEAQTCDGNAAEFEWKAALDYARINRQGGWRIPNVKELLSIIDFSRRSPAIDPVAFPNSPNANFMSSTPLDKGDIYVHIVSFGNGLVEQQEAYRINGWNLRLVRRGRD